MRFLLNTRRVGHGGTLDPAATGVLVVLIGRATKLASWLGGGQKVYDATIRFGSATSTDDAEGEVIATAPVPQLTGAEIEESARGLIGEIEQIPPAVSAVRVDGQRAYKAARRGEPLNIAARLVSIASIQVIEWRSPDLRVRVSCGTGTYIRSLARDWAQMLGSVGHVVALRRERSGPYRVEDAITLDEAAAQIESGGAESIVRPPDAEIVKCIGRTVVLSESEELRYRFGTQVENIAGDEGTVAVLGRTGNLIGVADLRISADGCRLLQPRVIMAPAHAG